MTSPPWKRQKELFQAALALALAERARFLDEACTGDDVLHREIESLLEAHDEAGGFLSRPVGLDVEEAGAPAPQRIGPYQILDTIAHGGMGTIYRAVRDDDVFRKTVALKLVRGGHHSDDFERRFRRERQILAGLQHPNIATVLDGGTTENGQPYLVMEYLEGRPITDFCAAQGVGTRGRLALFRRVCDAVQYAHQNLVVHRDIKPANVLVDSHGVPKLLDFGIAKLLASGIDPDRAATATVLPLMTPEYASPEQVRGQTITTESDVYSLGVLLYELLAGRRPYELRADSLEAIVKTVCETEPPSPSETVAGAARPDLALPAASELRGDLDTIVLKALRKEPERRYRTAHDLSEDLRRHLDGLPVTARADTIGYRTGKFLRRNRVAAAGTVLVAASVVAGVVTTIRQAHIAEANRRQAEQRFADVRGLAAFVMFDMHDAISGLPGSTPARKQLVEKSLEYLDRVGSEATNDPALLAELAAGYHRLSELQGAGGVANLGDRPGAVASARKSIALRERVAASRPDDASALVSLALAHGLLANLVADKDAHVSLAEMKAALEALPAAAAGRREALGAWEEYWHLLALERRAAGDLPGESESRRRQVEIAEQRYAAEPSLGPRSVAVAYKYYSGALQRRNDREKALVFAEKALALDRQIVAKDPVNPHHRLDLSFSHAQVAALLREKGDLDGALAGYRSALELRRAAHAEDPANEQAFRSLVRAHQSIAEVLGHKGDVDGTVLHARNALELRVRWEATHPSRLGPRAWQASFHETLGEIFDNATNAQPPVRRRDLWRRARTEYARALALWKEIAADTPLEAADAGRPEALTKAIAGCDRKLAERERGRSLPLAGGRRD
jgi:non-specific serine/threonine protein kinase/serine/threonine-protein kinase